MSACAAPCHTHHNGTFADSPYCGCINAIPNTERVAHSTIITQTLIDGPPQNFDSSSDAMKEAAKQLMSN